MSHPMDGKRLRTIARYINEHLPQFEAKIVEGFCNTDRKLSGSRLVWSGKGRTGNRLKVRKRPRPRPGGPIRDFGSELVLDHNAAETYRCNAEVVQWIERVESGWKPPVRGGSWI